MGDGFDSEGDPRSTLIVNATFEREGLGSQPGEISCPALDLVVNETDLTVNENRKTTNQRNQHETWVRVLLNEINFHDQVICVVCFESFIRP